MQWNPQKYSESCGGVTERGKSLVEELRTCIHSSKRPPQRRFLRRASPQNRHRRQPYAAFLSRAASKISRRSGIPHLRIQVLKGKRCERVLDLGCGTGVLTNEIASFVREVIGADASPAMIEKARQAYPGPELVVRDARALGWTAYFDAVFSNAVFHFIKEQDALLQSIHTALRENGILVCEFGAAGNISALLDAMSQACIKRGKPYTLRFYYPSEAEYRQKLEEHGFQVEAICVYDIKTPLQEGESGLRNWIHQVFSVEMGWFSATEQESVLEEIESALRPGQWDGLRWSMPNRRLRVKAIVNKA